MTPRLENPMTTEPTFTDRSNARRAAKRLLAAGQAPAADFDILPSDDERFAPPRFIGRFVIHWRTPEAAETAAADQPAMTPDEALDSICGAGTAAIMTAAVSETTEPAPAKPVRQRKARTAKTDMPAAPKGPRAKFAGAPVEPGKLPEKPMLTAAGFAGSHQKRIDHLAGLAEAGDWAAVEGYVVNGKNTYSKIVARYRAQLLAAHAANAQGAGQ
jgi:hypothetical protein